MAAVMMKKWTKRDGAENHPAVTKRGNKLVIAYCDRCAGRGYIECFRHVDNGRCFRCGGDGEVSFERSTITERTVAFIEKEGITGERADRLFDQARARFVKWVTEKEEREAQDFALAIWQSGGHVDRETNRDSWFVCRVREIVSELYRTRGTAPRQV